MAAGVKLIGNIGQVGWQEVIQRAGLVPTACVRTSSL